jgi:hypothetical protein
MGSNAPAQPSSRKFLIMNDSSTHIGAGQLHRSSRIQMTTQTATTKAL